MRLEYLQLEETIKSLFNSKPVYYIANHGNWGDGLIRAGTLKFFNNIGLEYKEIEYRKKDLIIPYLTKANIIFGGGGGWCNLWSESYRRVARLSKRCKVLVLPSSYEEGYYVPNVTFFSRDKYESSHNMPGSLFCHDMALYLPQLTAQKGSGKGYFLRTDPESAKKIEIPPENKDLSLYGDHFSDLYPFFEELSGYKTIYTDRLHVCIAACLLNKEVHLYSGSYFKIRAVYESSIKGYFDNVHFHEDFEIS